jgi:predicted SAM-dependent methyltransferase
MSETNDARPFLAKYCNGIGLDVGFGGSAIVPHAITFDMDKPYCPSFEGHRQILRGDCKSLHMFCDCSLDYIYSSHLLEDFTYTELEQILKEWRRVLKNDGLLITNCPDQQKFLAHCKKTGQGINLAHKEQDFSLTNFLNITNRVGKWEQVYVLPQAGNYSFYVVLKKI